MKQNLTFDLNEVVTFDNVFDLGRHVSCIAARHYSAIAPYPKVIALYRGLVNDIKSNTHQSNYALSDGYDLIQEVVCFLCENVGKKLGDMTTVIKHGIEKDVTVLHGCYITAHKVIGRVFTDERKCKSIDTEEFDEPIIEVNFENNIDKNSNDGWDVVDNILSKLNVTPIERETINYLLVGTSLSQTAKNIRNAVSSVFERRMRLQKRYLQVMGSL